MGREVGEIEWLEGGIVECSVLESMGNSGLAADIVFLSSSNFATASALH